MCDCPDRMCPNLRFLVRAHRDLMALGNLTGDSHLPLAMDPEAPAQVRSGCPIQPCPTSDPHCGQLISSLRSLLDGPQPALLEGPPPGLPPAGARLGPGLGSFLAMSGLLLEPVTCTRLCLPVSYPRGRHPNSKGMARDGVTPAQPLSWSSPTGMRGRVWRKQQRQRSQG